MKCDYCSSLFEDPNPRRKYCPNKDCAKRAARIKKFFRQKKAFGTDKPRKCGRCKKSMMFYGMSKLCEECKAYCKENPYEYRRIRT